MTTIGMTDGRFEIGFNGARAGGNFACLVKKSAQSSVNICETIAEKANMRQEFQFDRVETTTRTIRLKVWANDEMTANVRASVGPLSHVLDKESVELVSDETTETCTVTAVVPVEK